MLEVNPGNMDFWYRGFRILTDQVLKVFYRCTIYDTDGILSCVSSESLHLDIATAKYKAIAKVNQEWEKRASWYFLHMEKFGNLWEVRKSGENGELLLLTEEEVDKIISSMGGDFI